jgi:hypothetical protein
VKLLYYSNIFISIFSQGGAQKIRLLHEYLLEEEKKNGLENTVVLFVDGYFLKKFGKKNIRKFKKLKNYQKI